MKIVFLMLVAFSIKAAPLTAKELLEISKEIPTVEKCINDHLRPAALNGEDHKSYVPGPCGDSGISSDCNWQVEKGLKRLGYKVKHIHGVYNKMGCTECCDAVEISWGKKK